MTYSVDMEVLSITQATDAITGEGLYQVGFGRMGKPTEEYQVAAQTPLKKVGSNLLVLFIPLQGECPYKAGSKWRLTVDDAGEAKLQSSRRAK